MTVIFLAGIRQLGEEREERRTPQGKRSRIVSRSEHGRITRRGNRVSHVQARDSLGITGSLSSASRFLTTTRHVCGHAPIEETTLLRELEHKTLTQRCDLAATRLNSGVNALRHQD